MVNPGSDSRVKGCFVCNILVVVVACRCDVVDGPGIGDDDKEKTTRSESSIK